MIDVRSAANDAIRVEPAGELRLRIRASLGLRAGILGLLFAHGGQVIAVEHREA